MGPYTGSNGHKSPLRLRREEMGMRQEDVADKAGCVTSTVSMVESGWRPRRPDVLERIAVAVGASYGSFFE